MPPQRKRHPLNAVGPFYVENGCCTACMAPHMQAPDMMGFDDTVGHCFIKQQPSNDESVYGAIRALWSTETACIRYAGDDPEILRRLAEVGASFLCDAPID